MAIQSTSVLRSSAHLQVDGELKTLDQATSLNLNPEWTRNSSFTNQLYKELGYVPCGNGAGTEQVQYFIL